MTYTTITVTPQKNITPLDHADCVKLAHMLYLKYQKNEYVPEETAILRIITEFTSQPTQKINNFLCHTYVNNDDGDDGGSWLEQLVWFNEDGGQDADNFLQDLTEFLSVTIDITY